MVNTHLPAATLLIELLTEELPPKRLLQLSETFAKGVFDELAALGLLAAGAEGTPYATPRRLAVKITQVLPHQPEQQVTRKGPAVATGLDAAGKPTQALLGFAKSCGVAVESLTRFTEGKQDYFLFETTKPGEALASHLSTVVAQALKKLPAPKLMRWGNSDIQFIRPVHGLIMLHGDQIVAGTVLGLASGRETLGHRFLAHPPAITIDQAEEYESVLREKGSVVASYTQRKQHIQQQLMRAAGSAKLAGGEALLDEVTALVEYPVVYEGQFDPQFLAVPQECLILSMQQHQKYFPLLDKSGKLLPRFLLVSNLKTADPSQIIHGNERVLRARLSDAQFFFEQDKKTSLTERVPKLANVVYHNKLGSQLQRVERIQQLAVAIAGQLQADSELTKQAAYLAKADLLTDMVGEFPELQGTMGKYYALHDGALLAVAEAIEAHYWPRFSGDRLPRNPIEASVALADKLETLVGIYGIGLIPTGDKDPFGLRRQALGVLRILMKTSLPLDLLVLLNLAQQTFDSTALASTTLPELYQFMLDRLRHYLSVRGYSAEEVEAVVCQNPVRIDQVLLRLAAVKAFCRLPEAASLVAANKRISNILKKTEATVAEVTIDLLKEPAEQALFELILDLAPKIERYTKTADFTAALTLSATARQAVDTFFDQVMVMADDLALRQNRLALLAKLQGLLNQVADLSKLAI